MGDDRCPYRMESNRSLGIPQTVMKFVAGSAAKGNKEELIEYISSALTVLYFPVL